MIENEKRFTVRNLTKSFGCGYSGIDGELIKELAEDGETVLDLKLEIWDNGKAMTFETCCSTLNQLWEENQALKKELQLTHMRAMFSTVKSFKGDISERYQYDEETDTIYDTANHYGQYHKILDKKEVTMLLNEYNTLLGDDD